MKWTCARAAYILPYCLLPQDSFNNWQFLCARKCPLAKQEATSLSSRTAVTIWDQGSHQVPCVNQIRQFWQPTPVLQTGGRWPQNWGRLWPSTLRLQSWVVARLLDFIHLRPLSPANEKFTSWHLRWKCLHWGLLLEFYEIALFTKTDSLWNFWGDLFFQLHSAAKSSPFLVEKTVAGKFQLTYEFTNSRSLELRVYLHIETMLLNTPHTHVHTHAYFIL